MNGECYCDKACTSRFVFVTLGFLYNVRLLVVLIDVFVVTSLQKICANST